MNPNGRPLAMLSFIYPGLGKSYTAIHLRSREDIAAGVQLPDIAADVERGALAVLLDLPIPMGVVHNPTSYPLTVWLLEDAPVDNWPSVGGWRRVRATLAVLFPGAMLRYGERAIAALEARTSGAIGAQLTTHIDNAVHVALRTGSALP